MTPREFYAKHKDENRDRIVEVCREAQTSVANFQQIAIAGGSVGKALAKRLSEASGNEMTVMEILFPEDYEEKESA